MVKNFVRRVGAVTTAALVLLFVFQISSCKNGTSYTVISHPAMAPGSVIVILSDTSSFGGSQHPPSPKYVYVGKIEDPIPAEATIQVNISFKPAP
jgi:hypothetical protein